MEYNDFSGFFEAEDAQQQQQQQLAYAQGHAQHYMQPPATLLQDATRAAQYANAALPPQSTGDTKPRLTKEQHDVLENHYQGEPKPSTMTKKGLAAQLNISLEKINNWFQNRRAKTKSIIRKAENDNQIVQSWQSNRAAGAGAAQFQMPAPGASTSQHYTEDGKMAAAFGIEPPQHPHEPQQLQLPVRQPFDLSSDQFNDFAWPQQMPEEFGEALNRRTLTQEAFDDFARNAGLHNANGQFQRFDYDLTGNQELQNHGFGQVLPQASKQDDFNFYTAGLPVSAASESVTSASSDQSYLFPVDNSMQLNATAEWVDSRSSSMSMLQPDFNSTMTDAPQPQATSTVWQPGDSVPVDVNKQSAEFRQAALASSAVSEPSEQPLALPADDSFVRRGSQASVLAQSMDNVSIRTPHPDQPAIKAPAPPSNIAARRQRPRPAPIGLGAPRSQSYAGHGQAASPGHGPQPQLTQDQQLRRIRSAVVVNGGVAQGRIMKSTPGSAQRSPVNMSFANAMVSPSFPSFMRSASHGNLAPPTPLTPHELAQQQQFGTVPYTGYSAMGQNDYGMPYAPSASVPPQKASSPPVTPMYNDYSFITQNYNSFVENTPPQSAPAGQSCFPSNIFATVPQQSQQSMYQQAPPQQAPPAPPAPPQQSHSRAPAQHQQQTTVTFAPSQHSNVTTGPPPGIPLQFANGIPTVTAEGTAKISFPPQAQLMHQQSQQMSSSPQGRYAFVTTSSTPPSMHAIPQVPGELHVHQYSPPDAMKRASTPRKGVETGPKLYTFTNHMPSDFEGKKLKRGEAHDSASPASSNGTASTTSTT